MRRLFNATKNKLRQARHRRVRAKILGISERPRLSVFRSLRFVSAQLIDDQRGETICAANSKEIEGKKTTEGRRAKVAESYLAGRLLAERAKTKGIARAVFDRGGYRYHGRVKALAEGAREGGLSF